MANLLDKDDDHVEIDESKNYLTELVGEGKKFKTPEDMAKGKYLADQQIEIMKRRMDEMREDFLKAQEELKTRASIEEMLDRAATRNQDNRDNTEMREMDKKPLLDPNELESLFDKKLSMYEKQKTAEANRVEVESKLKERYGNNYKSVLAKQAEELNISGDELTYMAERNPKLFFKTFELDRQNNESFDAPIRGTTRNTFTPNTGEKRTWSYYKKMRKDNPTEYYSGKVQNQIIKDMQELGDAFQDGDFNIYIKR